jgi:ferredoxin--NADP+ reductase/benzoate/toluate 1,2-dioxygenase reductase subunit
MENIVNSIATGKMTSLVLSIRNLTESTYILRFERNGLEFQAGQYVVLGTQGSKQKREYSIYSSVTVPYIEVLIKEVEDGFISKKLKNISPGETIEVEGPFGYFVIDEKRIPERKYLFVASGTGISPFHSMVRSNPHLNYTLLHGVRHLNEGYDRHIYEKGRYIQCTSKEKGSEFYGRVTDYLRKNPVDLNLHCYLCGNSAMVDEVYTILQEQGIPANRLHAEIYF